MDKRKLTGIIISLIIIFSMMYVVHQSKMDGIKNDDIQNRIINNSIETLIQKNDIEALTVLAKENNSRAKTYLEEKAKKEAEIKAKNEAQARKERAKIDLDIAKSMLERKTAPDTIREAKLYLSNASEQGFLEATNMLAKINLIGIGQNQNFDDARKQFEILIKSPNKYQNEAYSMLFIIYFNGLGTEQDIKKAKEMLSALLEKHNSADTAIYMLQTQAKLGNVEAINLLKELNIPLPKLQYDELFLSPVYTYKEWAEKEALNNNPTAYHYLTTIAGIEMRFDDAVKYAKKAIENGIGINEQRGFLDMFRTYSSGGNLKSIEFSKELSAILTKNQDPK